MLAKARIGKRRAFGYTEGDREAREGAAVPDEQATQKNESKDGAEGEALRRLNYVVIAALFFLAGLLAGAALFRQPAPERVQIDEGQMRAIVADVLAQRAERDQVEEEQDRFALVDDDPYLGEADAPVVIVEFSDFFCSYCKRHFDQTFRPLLENYGRYIRYVYRDFARLTAESTPAAAAARCAFEQGKFWEFHGAFFSSQEDLGREFYLQTAEEQELDLDVYSACLDGGSAVEEVQIDGFDGEIAGVRGTPGFFINGQILSGAQPYSIFERMILRELAKAGIDPAGD